MTKTRDYETYNSTSEWKIQRQLSKMLQLQTTNITDNEVKKIKELMVLDTLDVMGVVAKTTRAKRILRKFTRVKMGTSLKDFTKVPFLNYTKHQGESSAGFSLKYLTMIVNFFNIIYELRDTIDEKQPRWYLKKDYALTIDSIDWKILLAPRVDEE